MPRRNPWALRPAGRRRSARILYKRSSRGCSPNASRIRGATHECATRIGTIYRSVLDQRRGCAGRLRTWHAAQWSCELGVNVGNQARRTHGDEQQVVRGGRGGIGTGGEHAGAVAIGGAAMVMGAMIMMRERCRAMLRACCRGRVIRGTESQRQIAVGAHGGHETHGDQGPRQESAQRQQNQRSARAGLVQACRHALNDTPMSPPRRHGPSGPPAVRETPP
jgi:hypothetical protein